MYIKRKKTKETKDQVAVRLRDVGVQQELDDSENQLN